MNHQDLARSLRCKELLGSADQEGLVKKESRFIDNKTRLTNNDNQCLRLGSGPRHPEATEPDHSDEHRIVCFVEIEYKVSSTSSQEQAQQTPEQWNAQGPQLPSS